MRSVLRVLCCFWGVWFPLSAASHPAWWGFASPQATALVGVKLNALAQSPLGQPLLEELFAADGLAIPGLECLKQSQQVLLSAPDLLIVFNGRFPAASVKAQAQAGGLRRSWYKEQELWIPRAATALGLLRWSDQVTLVGSRTVLEAAIDRVQSETGREYSPLLAQAARWAQEDLWIVSGVLPDPLAAHFLPFEVSAQSFSGGVSLTSGFSAEAVLTAASAKAATALVRGWSKVTQPAILRGLEASAEGPQVTLRLAHDPQQLAALLRPTEPAAPPVRPRPEPKQIAVNGVLTSLLSLPETPAAPVASPVAAKPAPLPSPPVRRVIRIVGLDEGPREIPFPPAP